MDFEALYPETCSTVSQAALNGNYTVLKCLLESGKASNIQDNRGWRALHYAAAGGHLKCVQLLLKAHDVDVNAVTFMRETALHLVCGDGHMKSYVRFTIAKLLLKNGADPNADKHDRYKTVLNLAILKDELKLVKLLLDYKADINEVDDAHGSPLDTAVQSSDNEDMVKLILQQRLKLNPLKDAYKHQFFHIIIMRKKLNFLKLCLQHPQCSRFIDYQFEDYTPLMRACSRWHWFDGIDLLLDYGANANIHFPFGRLALERFVLYYFYYDDDDEENICRIFWRLFHATSTTALKVDNQSYSSIFHALLESNDWATLKKHNGCIKKMLLKLICEQSRIKPNSSALYRSFCTPTSLSSCFHDEKEWIDMALISPLACFFLQRVWDSEILNALLLDVEDVNDISEERIPPLVTASACCLWDDSRETLVHRLLDKGADARIKIGADNPLPMAFLFAITHVIKGPLEFLLKHSVPAQVVFVPTCFTPLKTMYQRKMIGDRYTNSLCDHQPACYKYLVQCLSSIVQWLRCVDRFIPVLPQNALELVDIFREFVDIKYLATEAKNSCCSQTTSDSEIHGIHQDEDIESYPVEGMREAVDPSVDRLLLKEPEHSCGSDIDDDASQDVTMDSSYKKAFIQKYKNSVRDVQHLVGSIKPLRLLCILKIRFIVWNRRRHLPICDSVRAFAREADLPPPIERLLLLGAQKDSCYGATSLKVSGVAGVGV